MLQVDEHQSGLHGHDLTEVVQELRDDARSNKRLLFHHLPDHGLQARHIVYQKLAAALLDDSGFGQIVILPGDRFAVGADAAGDVRVGRWG